MTGVESAKFPPYCVMSVTGEVSESRSIVNCGASTPVEKVPPSVGSCTISVPTFKSWALPQRVVAKLRSSLNMYLT